MRQDRRRYRNRINRLEPQGKERLFNRSQSQTGVLISEPIDHSEQIEEEKIDTQSQSSVSRNPTPYYEQASCGQLEEDSSLSVFSTENSQQEERNT
mmetsp:Transcript_24729/g.24535  ORF Transcript_24729/g.24535 Transcript_24729/m.24535 type:complete len:96 (+) Transcript_24729:120-407(+)